MSNADGVSGTSITSARRTASRSSSPCSPAGVSTTTPVCASESFARASASCSTPPAIARKERRSALQPFGRRALRIEIAQERPAGACRRASRRRWSRASSCRCRLWGWRRESSASESPVIRRVAKGRIVAPFRARTPVEWRPHGRHCPPSISDPPPACDRPPPRASAPTRGKPNSRPTSSGSACAARSARRSATYELIAPHDRVMVCLSGRQGQLRPARHPADAQGPRAVPVRGHRREPRPEAAGLSGRRAAALPRVARRAVPHRRAGHLQRRQARDSRRRHDVLALLAAAARRALSRRRARSAPRRSRSAITATTSSRRSSSTSSSAAS